jgi:hypothetical protein
MCPCEVCCRQPTGPAENVAVSSHGVYPGNCLQQQTVTMKLSPVAKTTTVPTPVPTTVARANAIDAHRPLGDPKLSQSPGGRRESAGSKGRSPAGRLRRRPVGYTL